MDSLSKVRSRMSFTFFLAILCLVLLGPAAESAHAHRKFGFRGGFRGSFGRSFNRGRRSFSRGRSFSNRRFSSFRRFNYRGFRGFGRSRFNTLAFRGRRFSRGGFNRFNQFNRLGFRGSRSRFTSFRPSYRTFAFNHFPVKRVHSSFGTFHRPTTFVANTYPTGPNHFTSVRLPSHVAAGTGWTHLANGQPALAQTAFASDIAAGGSPGIARVGYSLAAADGGDLTRGVWAMRRAFEADKDMAASLMMDDEMSELAARVTRLYERRMEDNGVNSDDAFMLAAMYQLQGDPEMAMMAMDYALKANDTQISTSNLNQLIESEMSTIPMDNSAAWKLLAAGKNQQAIETFVQEISLNDKAGAPKLGYALAMAASGDLTKGTWALRRAFDIDPEGTSDVMLSGKLRSVLESITEKYVVNAETNGVTKDNSFTLATLFMLQGDIEGAEMIVKNSTVDPDSFVATMIVSEMKSQMAMMDEATEKMEDVKENSYDEFLMMEEALATTDSAAQGSSTQGSSTVSPAPQGSATKNLTPASPVTQGSSTQGSATQGFAPVAPVPLVSPVPQGSDIKPVAPQGSSTQIPAEPSSDSITVPLGSGTQTPPISGSGTNLSLPPSRCSGTR